MSFFMGLDIGTTSTSGLIIDNEGRIISIDERPVKLVSKNAGWAEQNPLQWWKNVCLIVPSLIKKANITSDVIKGIGVSGMLPALVILDADNRLVRNSIQQSDGRSGEEVSELKSEISEKEFLKLTGNGINQQIMATKLRWLEKHENQNFKKIHTILGSYDFINFMFTGNKRVDRNWALECGFININKNQIDPDLVRLSHIRNSCIPKLSFSSEIIGEISQEAALATGLRVGTPVAGGSADHISSAFASGINEEGSVLLKFGGATDIMTCSGHACMDSRLFLDYHLIPGKFVPNGCMSTGGTGLNWLIETFNLDSLRKDLTSKKTIHQLLDQKISHRIPRSQDLFVLPYFLGEKTPIHDADARGVIFGLSFSHSIGDIWRAFLESYCYALKDHINVFHEIGFNTNYFVASDGGTKSKIWMHICSDVIQEPITVLEDNPGSCLGAAWMSVIATESTAEWRGIESFVKRAYQVEPKREFRCGYEDGFIKFKTIYHKLKDEFS